MRVLFDTSILVAGFVASHPKHHSALPWLQRAKSKEIISIVSTHSLAECFAVLTRLPVSPRITSETANYLLRENVIKISKLISLSSNDYQNVLKHMAELGLPGGSIFDALILKAAKNAKVNKLLTFNLRDFTRLSPHDSSWIISP